MHDTWSTMSRDSNGNLVADPTKFHNGIKSLADEIHGMGLKFGLYGNSGTKTCSGYPGSQGYETQDAQQLTTWGVDYWKYDNCNTPSRNSQPRYTVMRDALPLTNSKILYSLCNWGADSVWTRGSQVGNSWRVGGDITDAWSSVASIAASNTDITSYATPGSFNDYYMMEISNGGLSEAEERAHFGLYAICKSPIILGIDPTKISSSSLNIIKNKAIIAINQDSLSKAASTFTPKGQPAPSSSSLYPYWAGPLSDGIVIGLIAFYGAATLTVNLADVPVLGSGGHNWTELYSGRIGSGTGVSADLGLHDMAIFRVSTKGGLTATTIATGSTSTTTSVVSTTMVTSGGSAGTGVGAVIE